MIEKKDPNGQAKVEPTKAIASQKKSVEVKIWAQDDAASLAVVIGRVFDLQKQYGKTPAQLESIVAGFLWALAPYDPTAVIAAFGVYILSHSDMPSPFDIRQIIDPIKPDWVPDKAYYVSLKQLEQHGGKYALNTEEIEYVKKYEDHVKKS